MNFDYTFPLKLNIPSFSFRSKAIVSKPTINVVTDGFASNPIYNNFNTKAKIEAIARLNPKIQELLSEYKNKNVDIVNMYKKIARTSYSDDRSSRNIYFENYSEDMIRENEYLNNLFFKSTLKNKAEI